MSPTEFLKLSVLQWHKLETQVNANNKKAPIYKHYHSVMKSRTKQNEYNPKSQSTLLFLKDQEHLLVVPDRYEKLDKIDVCFQCFNV